MPHTIQELSGMVAGGNGGQYIEVFVRFKKMGPN